MLKSPTAAEATVALATPACVKTLDEK